MTTITIDAKGRSIGRVASEAAAILIGKNNVAFTRNNVIPSSVTIVNAAQASMSEKKKLEKKYTNYSGYPGGLRTRTLGKVIDSRGAKEAVRIAVKGMLPKNKLQNIMMKNLTITD